MNTFKQVSMILIFSTMIVLTVQATDNTKEERWANQVTEFLLDGDPEWLEASGKKFLSIFTPAVTDNTVGAVILLHGRGAHPDWPQVIQPLRTRLPETGWATLSLQMPVLSGDAFDRDYIMLFDEVPERIKAALHFLSKKNITNIVLIGHSLGATMATDYLSRKDDERIKAFVGIGMKAMKQPDKYRALDNANSLQKIKLPVLDIYGSKTIEEILYSADLRSMSIRQAGNAKSRQIKIEGTGHFFEGYEDKLLDSILKWIDETTPVNEQSLSAINNKPQ